MAGIPPWYLDACRSCTGSITEADIEKFVHSPFWNEMYKQVISRSGMHIFIMGQTYGGKTQKLRHFLKWIAPKETVIWIDTGKPGDLHLMLTLGKPVQILHPYGCKLELRGEIPAEVEIVPVFDPVQYWKEIKKGWINIITLSNFFLEENNHRAYVRQMFKNFILNAKLGAFKEFTPCTIAADEAQSILGSGRVSASAEAKATGQDAANVMRQIRAMGIRWIIVSQSYYDIVGGARENAPCYVVSRGTKVDRRDHATLHYLSGFAETCEAREGWVVMPNGRFFDRQDSLKFPLYHVPDIRVLYRGFVDEIRDLPEDEDLFERIDLGVFSAMLQKPEAEPVIASRYSFNDVVLT